MSVTNERVLELADTFNKTQLEVTEELEQVPTTADIVTHRMSQAIRVMMMAINVVMQVALLAHALRAKLEIKVREERQERLKMKMRLINLEYTLNKLGIEVLDIVDEEIGEVDGDDIDLDVFSDFVDGLQ
jgi:hypothetical protein